MRYSTTITIEANDIIGYARDILNKKLFAHEISNAFDYIDNNFDCNLSYWDNINKAIEFATKEQIRWTKKSLKIFY